jgi:hypothetical protein
MDSPGLTPLNRREFLASAAAIADSKRASPERRRYLFLDSRIVERAENAVLRVGKIRKDPRNPLFGEDKPWEARFDNLYANVVREPSTGLYRCWYSPFILDEAVRTIARADRKSKPYRALKREMGVCYAESRDGLEWHKPSLGLTEFEGSRENNLVCRGPHGAGVFRDAHEQNPARRYKMLFQDRTTSGAFSPDGIHWTDPVPFASIGAVGDTHNNAIWADTLSRYAGITRLWDRSTKQRLVGRTESENFLDWTKAVEILRADPRTPQSQTYAMPVFEYAGLYLGLLMVFHVPSDTVACELAWSADTLRWERIDPGNPLIPLGGAAAYDNGCVYAAATPVVLDGAIRLYYGASNGPHTGWRDGFFCLAHLRPDGFSAMEARDAATVITRPAEVTGDSLRVNVDATYGELRVGVLGEERLSVERSVALRGDHIDTACRWRGASMGRLRGKRVQLVFALRSARVYSFSFAG